MISNPRYGWCSFKLGDFKGSPSYLTDVPVDLLNAFIDYYTKGYGVAVFDQEGSYFTLVMSVYNWGVFIIEEKDSVVLHDLCYFHVDDLKEELIRDIEKDMNGWSDFIIDDDTEEIKQHRNEIRQRLAKLKQFT